MVEIDCVILPLVRSFSIRAKPCSLYHVGVTLIRRFLYNDSLLNIVSQSWVGIMLMRQAFYVGGVEDLELAKANAFGAAGTFFFTFVISILYILKEGRKEVRRGSTTATFAEVMATGVFRDREEAEYGQLSTFSDFPEEEFNDEIHEPPRDLLS